MSRFPIPARALRFPRRFRFLPLLAVAALALGVSAARAEDEDVEEESFYAFNRAIGFDPVSIFFSGSLYGNYEQLLGLRHGLLAEGGYAVLGDYSGTWSAAAGYRYHFSPGLEGLFAGTYLKTSVFSLENLKIERKNSKYAYDVEGPYLSLGANLGYRWQWGNGLAATLRGGYGFPIFSDLEWSPDDGRNEDMKNIIENVLFGLDIEMTMGYSF
jgi:hypothetical protein